MSEQRNYMAEVQSLIDLKWKENPEEMKRVMAEIKAKEKKEKNAKVETPKRVSFDPQLTQELIEELNKSWDDVDITKVQDLIKRGADVDAKRNDGGTPLHWASFWNEIEAAKFLLYRGANVNAKDKDRRTPLYLACVRNAFELAKLLIEKGADVKAKDKDRWTPLHWASRDNRIEIAKLLLERGADVEAKDVSGRTPLDFAHSDEMKALLQKYMK